VCVGKFHGFHAGLGKGLIFLKKRLSRPSGTTLR
jgi:hypothetical protein